MIVSGWRGREENIKQADRQDAVVMDIKDYRNFRPREPQKSGRISEYRMISIRDETRDRLASCSLPLTLRVVAVVGEMGRAGVCVHIVGCRIKVKQAAWDLKFFGTDDDERTLTVLRRFSQL